MSNPSKDHAAHRCAQEYAAPDVLHPVEHDVGNVNNGGVLNAPNGWHGPFPRAPKNRQFQPRALSWRGSPGTPQNVTCAPMNSAVWEMLRTVTTTP
ncbi:MAG TPA: hypothetical protein VK672_04770 [Solirubrobacteraceae bacterium]|jgi:hypothetical protein|nr:hypothetical protein [Solirubrobacteraceae bacterium]